MFLRNATKNGLETMGDSVIRAISYFSYFGTSKLKRHFRLKGLPH